MAWYNDRGKASESVLCTKVQLRRNLTAYPFPVSLEAASANEILQKLSPPLEALGFRKINFSDISAIMATSYVEKHYASPAFASVGGPHVLLLQEKPDIAVTLCGEDHLRICCILPGLDPKEAFAHASEIERVLDEENELAFDPDLGYLTQSPADLGTGLSVSVMLFLPALAESLCIGSLASHLGKLGLSLRGGFGEGVSTSCGLFELSNRVTLGKDENEILSLVEEVTLQILEREEEARRAIRKEPLDRLTDRIRRSEAILKSALLLSSEEFLRLFADVRLGIALGIVRGITYEQLSTLLVEGMPATLTLSSDTTPRSEHARDALRAKRVQALLHEA